METSYIFGHLAYYDHDGGQWRYFDNHKLIDSEKRQCSRCGKYQTKEGYDHCQGYIENAVSICCGHGVVKPIKILEK